MTMYSNHEMPSIEDFEALRHQLAGIGIGAETVDKLDVALLSWMVSQGQTLAEYQKRLRCCDERSALLEADVIRLRGQRDALRQALLRRNQEDPMQGYASDHMLAAIRPEDGAPQD
ncbi:MAG: hypothetical protein PF961_08125 [Planctomycetota bacterium]|nr:hypothetical protein [Planctomycetota bacterium]